MKVKIKDLEKGSVFCIWFKNLVANFENEELQKKLENIFSELKCPVTLTFVKTHEGEVKEIFTNTVFSYNDYLIYSEKLNLYFSANEVNYNGEQDYGKEELWRYNYNVMRGLERKQTLNNFFENCKRFREEDEKYQAKGLYLLLKRDIKFVK